MEIAETDVIAVPQVIALVQSRESRDEAAGGSDIADPNQAIVGNQIAFVDLLSGSKVGKKTRVRCSVYLSAAGTNPETGW
jgi:hypothetical protein